MADAAEKQTDPLGMSDDEFSNLNVDTAFSEELASVANDEETEDTNQEPETAEAEDSPAGAVEGEGSDTEEETEDNEEDLPEAAEADQEEEPESDDESDPEDMDDTTDPHSEDEDSDVEETEEEPADAAKDFYEKVTAPFKANGQQMQIKEPEDVIRLMQMGANYNKKMAGLKPVMKVAKMLERNKLLDEERISFLIDLDKKDPTAIAKLLKDSDLDPMDLDLEEGTKYKPSDKYSIDERELALDSVIDEIRDTETYPKTLDVVSNQWDDASRNIVANTPELLKVINDHMSNGIYDLISTEVAKERTLGRLNGVSDIDAYRQIGDTINSKGGFDHLFKQEQRPQPKPKKNPPSPKSTTSNDERKAKRRAASPTKPAPSSSKTQDFNPLALSDDEFMKQFDDRFL